MTTERWLHLLGQQSLLLSLGILAMALLRPLLLRTLGARACYLAWLALPAMLLAGLLPHPVVARALPWTAPLAAGQLALGQMLPMAEPRPLLAPLLMAAWALGVALIAAGLLRRQRRFERLLHRVDGEPHWRLPAALGPVSLGVLRGRIALPEDFEKRFAAEEQALILAHEQVHLRRRDNAWNLLALAIAALHWFNPLTWWALRRLREDQELSCDAAVLARDPRPRQYAQALLKSVCLTSPPAALACPWPPAHPLIERVSMLKSHRQTARRRALSFGLSLVLVAGSGLATYAAQAETAPEAAASAVPPVQPGYTKVWLDMKLALDGKPVASPQMLTMLATTASIRMDMAAKGEAADPWMIAVTPTAHAEGQILLDASIARGTPLELQAQPRLIVGEGQPARIEFSSKDRRHVLRVDVIARYFRTELHDSIAAEAEFRRMLKARAEMGAKAAQ